MSDCPYCGAEPNHLNNHVRMKNDDSHGPTQTYPDDWDPDKGQRTGETEGSTESEGGRTIDGFEEDDEDPPNELAAKAGPVELGDDPADAREYECGECGEEIQYLDAECGNGHEPQWTGVSA